MTTKAVEDFKWELHAARVKLDEARRQSDFDYATYNAVDHYLDFLYKDRDRVGKGGFGNFDPTFTSEKLLDAHIKETKELEDAWRKKWRESRNFSENLEREYQALLDVEEEDSEGESDV